PAKRGDDCIRAIARLFRRQQVGLVQDQPAGLAQQLGVMALQLLLDRPHLAGRIRDRKSTRLNSSHVKISYAVFCLKKKKNSAPPRSPAGHSPTAPRTTPAASCPLPSRPPAARPSAPAGLHLRRVPASRTNSL